jgi:hypothetical protein
MDENCREANFPKDWETADVKCLLAIVHLLEMSQCIFHQCDMVVLLMVDKVKKL